LLLLKKNLSVVITLLLSFYFLIRKKKDKLFPLKKLKSEIQAYFLCEVYFDDRHFCFLKLKKLFLYIKNWQENGEKIF